MPGLGGFMAHYICASYSEEENLFLPPQRTLGFNPQLQLNDHLLVQSYIEAYDLSYPEALRRMESEVRELWQHLEAKGQYELNGIGVLSMNDEGKLEFEPCEAGILTPELYGLNTFVMPTVEQLIKQKAAADKLSVETQTEENATKADILEFEFPADEQEPQDEEAETHNDAIVIPMSWIRNSVAIAATILLFFMMTKPVSNSHEVSNVVQSTMMPMQIASQKADTPRQEAQTSVSQQSAKSQQQKTVAESKVETKDSKNNQSASAAVQKQSVANPHYVIVLASQTTMNNARDFVYRLEKHGYDNTHIVEMNGSNKVRVVYGTYSTESEAQQQLRNLRLEDDVFQDAWTLKID